MNERVMYDTMTWPEAKERIPKARAIIVSLGSVEEHGYHLPLCTDNILGSTLAAGIAEKTDSLVLPVMPFGQVWSTRDFPGSISLSEETIVRVLVDVALSLRRHGARNVIFHSGHMGNQPAMKAAARRLYDQYGMKNVWYFCYTDYVKLAEGIMEAPLWRGTGMHAAEIETSMMLAAAPELCHMERAVSDYPEGSDAMDYRCMPWTEFTETGALGDPTVATAEKGRVYTEKLIAHMADIINRLLG